MPFVAASRLSSLLTRMACGGALLASVLGVAGCSRTLDMTALKQSISDGVNAQLALPIASVECPADRTITAGDTFDCTATPEAGGRLTITVTQKDDEGNIAWEVKQTEGLLDLQKAEAAVAEGLKSQAQVDAKVDCGGRWKAIKVGETFECQVAITDGRTAVVEVTTEDAEGNIGWKVR